MANEENSEESGKIIQGDVSKNRVLSSLLWKFMEVGGTQIIRFVVQIVLARILCPSDYGIMAIVFAFITISDVFIQSGFNTALVQKKDSDELDFNSVFYLIFFISAVLYVILFFTAPFIASFYKMDLLKDIIRILSVVLFFDAVNAVQFAMVQKTMQFKKFFFSNMGGTIASCAVGVVMAVKGFGVWTLVTQQLVNSFLITLILWFTVKWRPKLQFSWSRLKHLFSFGWKLSLSAIIDV
ncbi:MAG: oligosaccharide flippase family protein, partial [Treponema sp.]|nr:oligosaccharide flippase family protein [Treponema sp.]